MAMKKITICTLLYSLLFYVNVSASNAHTGMRNISSLQVTADMGAGWNLGNSLDANPGPRPVGEILKRRKQ